MMLITTQPQLKMALGIHLVSSKRTVPCFSRSSVKASPRIQISISCTKNNRSSDSQLAVELATEVEKISAQMVQREEALNKSSKMLFKELCNYLGSEAQEVKKRWMRMTEKDKCALVKCFVSEWGSNFHPLSSKSVKELVDEYLVKNMCSR